MSSNRVVRQTSSATALVLFLLIGCNTIVGLDKLSVSDAPANNAGGGSTDQGGASAMAGNAAGGTDSAHGGSGGDAADGGEAGATPAGDCTTNQECTDRLTLEAMGTAGTAPAAGGSGGTGGSAGGTGGAGNGKVAAVCVKQGGAHCVALLSQDCDTITGNYLDDNAIVIGSLFSTKGTTAPTNLPRQQSAELAVEQIDMNGGIPKGSVSRPLVMVSCDESTDLVRASTHLVKDLHVPAIVGPNTSQDTLDVSTKVTIPGGTVVMSPTGVASSIASLADNDLTWLMVPSDVQRAPLMISQIGELEQGLKPDKAIVKLSIIFRNDALGIGTRTSLNDLVINGKPMADPINLNQNVKINPYNGADSLQTGLVTETAKFAPDIVVLAGTAEAITKIMVPLEAQWDTAFARPNYVLIDSTKVPELLTALTPVPPMLPNDDLRHRIRGTGITPGPTGKDTPAETFNGFQVDYNVRFGTSATISGMGPAHDAAYAIGLALAATADEPVSGKAVAKGLRLLAGGGTKYETSATNVRAAAKDLSMGKPITTIGSFGVLNWDPNGAVVGGTLEMWCIGLAGTKPVYGTSNLFFDIQSQKQSGAYVQCTP